MNILQFWLAADNFQNQLAAKKGQYDGLEAQNDAMILYDKYVPPPPPLQDAPRCHLGGFFMVADSRTDRGFEPFVIVGLGAGPVVYIFRFLHHRKCKSWTTEPQTQAGGF